jgi:hypothetical protein
LAVLAAKVRKEYAKIGNRKGEVKTMYGSTNSEGGSMKIRAKGRIDSEQYSLAKILGIWVLAAAPMGILGWMGWIVSPLLASNFGLDPVGVFVTRLVLLTSGGSGSTPRGSQRPEHPAQGCGCGWCRSSLGSRW